FLVKWISGGSTATNWVQFTSSITGSPVIVSSDGNDEHIDLVVKSHADGTLYLISPQNGDIEIALLGGGDIYMDTNMGGIIVNSSDVYKYVSNDPTLSADSAVTLPTQQAVKAYVDGSTPSLGQTFITNTDETASLPNSDPLALKPTGILASTTSTGVLNT